DAVAGVGLHFDAAVHGDGRGGEDLDHEIGGAVDDALQDAEVGLPDEQEVGLERGTVREDDVEGRKENFRAIRNRRPEGAVEPADDLLVPGVRRRCQIGLAVDELVTVAARGEPAEIVVSDVRADEGSRHGAIVQEHPAAGGAVGTPYDASGSASSKTAPPPSGSR